MRKSKNLNKTALEIINDINLRLRRGAIKDTNNELFRFGCDYLLKKNMYHGYNMFKKMPANYNTLTGKLEPGCDGYMLTEAGTSNKYEHFCLQIYIDANFNFTDKNYFED